MTTWIVIVFALIVGGAFLVTRKGKSTDEATPRRPIEPRANVRTAAKPHAAEKQRGKSNNGPAFHGEAFTLGKPHCNAAEALHNRTFKKGSNTQIPLAGCDMPDTCTCHMRELEERRHGERRINPDRRGDIRFADDRRSGLDRRKGVNAWKHDV